MLNKMINICVNFNKSVNNMDKIIFNAYDMTTNKYVTVEIVIEIYINDGNPTCNITDITINGISRHEILTDNTIFKYVYTNAIVLLWLYTNDYQLGYIKDIVCKKRMNENIINNNWLKNIELKVSL